MHVTGFGLPSDLCVGHFIVEFFLETTASKPFVSLSQLSLFSSRLILWFALRILTSLFSFSYFYSMPNFQKKS